MDVTRYPHNESPGVQLMPTKTPAFTIGSSQSNIKSSPVPRVCDLSEPIVYSFSQQQVDTAKPSGSQICKPLFQEPWSLGAKDNCFSRSHKTPTCTPGNTTAPHVLQPSIAWNGSCTTLKHHYTFFIPGQRGSQAFEPPPLRLVSSKGTEKLKDRVK